MKSNTKQDPLVILRWKEASLNLIIVVAFSFVSHQGYSNEINYFKDSFMLLQLKLQLFKAIDTLIIIAITITTMNLVNCYWSIQTIPRFLVIQNAIDVLIIATVTAALIAITSIKESHLYFVCFAQNKQILILKFKLVL